MSPGFEKGRSLATKEKQENPMPTIGLEGIEDELSDSQEIAIDEAKKRAKQVVDNFLTDKEEEINKCSTFSIDEYGDDHNANEHPSICDELARNQKKEEILDNKLSEVAEELENAQPGTVKQKVCAYKEAAFKNEIMKTQKKINSLKEEIKDSDEVSL